MSAANFVVLLVSMGVMAAIGYWAGYDDARFKAECEAWWKDRQ